MTAFGVYVLTHPGDYHLSAALINSLRYFNPDVPISLIPGDGFDPSDFPVRDVPVLEKPIAFRYESKSGYDRKFWSFGGPYDRFLYIDADVLNLRNIGSLISRISQEPDPFILVNLPYHAPNNEDFLSKLSSIGTASRDEQRAFHKSRIGNIDSIDKFDPSFDYNANFGFNGGLWASSKSSFRIEWFNDLRRKEEAFFASVLRKPYLDSNLDDLFYGDQGKLSYISYVNGVKVLDLHPDGYYVWGGKAFNISVADLVSNQSPAPFIHWAGVPRPSESLFTRFPLFFFLATLSSVDYTFKEQREVPARNAWEVFSVCQRKQILTASCRDFVWILKEFAKRLAAIVRLRPAPDQAGEAIIDASTESKG